MPRPLTRAIQYLVLLKEIHTTPEEPELDLEQLDSLTEQRQVLTTMKPELIYPELELPDLFGNQERFHRVSRPTKVPSKGYSDSQISFLQETADGLLTQIKRIQDATGMDENRPKHKASTRESHVEDHAEPNSIPKEVNRSLDNPSARETTLSSSRTDHSRSVRLGPEGQVEESAG